jgi:hypothetical protein
VEHYFSAIQLVNDFTVSIAFHGGSSSQPTVSPGWRVARSKRVPLDKVEGIVKREFSRGEDILLQLHFRFELAF